MGVPKFFRWMGERYPLCSQLITENAIPEFDNLYLDMNGIIHNCSLPNDTDAHFRLSEDKIFLAIFNYIDHLFLKIKPQKVFFMAVDGVAPRAKMNQQRSRRFRTAKDAEDAKRKAIAKGEELPEEEQFDRNCITPGTPFMKRLSAQLEYFISKKVTEDANWRGVKVVLSGHEVPGEGEHKIMEYIRLAKAQEEYNPNTRHCLYGLDADLIMLGLLSHEPHFALLREEVTFGRTNKKKGSIDTQNFFLMHLSLLREYLDMEFNTLQDTLPFPYDLERIIDDFVLMCLFIGNDFLPHLPNLHIAEGALTLLFNIYKKLLPQLGGYFQDSGELNFHRVEAMFHELAEAVESEAFEAECDDLKYIGGKMAELLIVPNSGSKNNGKHRQGMRMGKPIENANELVMTRRQKDLYDQIKEFVLERKDVLHFPPTLNSSERSFVKRIASAIEIRYGTETAPDDTKNLYIEFDEEEDDEDVESQEARARVMRKYDQAEVVEDVIENEKLRNEKAKNVYDDRLQQWKKDYYLEKPELAHEAEIRKMVFKYVEGLQWVLFYYYRGVSSWAWFYPYHYAPKISDLVHLDLFKIPFELGTPFKPYEQLMGVLPEASKKHIPQAYWDLITKEASPIKDFYPNNFELDMNGKKQDWEAIVKIPFIDQDRLLEAMKTKEHLLTPEEVERNETGESAVFTRDESLMDTYLSPLPSVFPDIKECKCKRSVFHLPVIEGVTSLRKGLCEGAFKGAEALFGFPSLDTIKHTGNLGYHSVQVFQAPSRNETMVVNIVNRFEDVKPEALALSKLGKRVFVGWPFLKEGIVSSISDEMFKYELQVQGKNKVVIKTPHRTNTFDTWRKRVDRIETLYNKRFGVVIGDIEFTAQVLLLKGLKREMNGALVKDFCKPGEEQEFAIQTLIDTIRHPDTRTKEEPPRPLNEDFPLDSQVFFLGHGHYGCPAQVIAHSDNALALRVAIPNEHKGEPTFGHEIVKEALSGFVYQPSFVVNKKVGISALILSKLTSSLHVVYRSTDRRINLGLNLKFEGKKQKVLGFTRKTESGWEFSQKAIALLQEYKKLFPEFIDGLEKRARSDFYVAEELYPNGDSVEKIKRIEDWLKKSKVKDFERVDLDAEQLDKETIALVEQAADAYVETRTGMKHVIVKNLGRHTMLKPSHAATILPDQTFKLGDRVVFVQDSGTVPIGAKGTVVGIDRLEVEVVFDDKFMSGMDLSGRCSMYRGMTVGPQSILNLSSPQCNQKAPATPATPAAVTPRPRPNLQPKPSQSLNQTDDNKPAGWDILGVAPAAEKPKKGPHQPKNQSNNHGNGGSSSNGGGRTLAQAPRGEQPNVHQNQSLGFHARPRPPVQIAVRPNSENNKPGAEEISALLLGILHKNVPADQVGHGITFGTATPALPAAGTQAAALLEHLRPRPPTQQQHPQHQHQQQPAPPPAWQDTGRIQQQHGGQPGAQQHQQGQRGVQRHPRPPPANGQPQAGNNNNNQRPPGFSNRGGNRGGHSQGQPRPTPANQSQVQGQNQAQAQGQGQQGPLNGGGNGKTNNERGNNNGNNNRRGRGRGGNRGGNKGGDNSTAAAAPATASAEGSSSSSAPAPAPAPTPSTEN
ncbi:MAG: XRN 5'-3' exonuclease N-terminus-domain-containing protein [Linnemannia gamsii]|nr:MAG: XRN 5'-3' exonuclease N-terminus-domain-containing protein [Linnemannia gamsii]